MKKMILVAVAVIVGTAGAGTLTGKIVLPTGSNASVQVCMNGSCAMADRDGSYSLNVTPSAIERQGSIQTASDLYRLGQYVVSASGKRVELINMKGQRVASEDGSLDISKVPTGMYMATDGRHALKINTMSQSGYTSVGNNGVATGVAARVYDTTSLLGVAYIVVDGDTLKEVPVTSWNLPTGYMVQRNVTVITGTKYSGDSTQVVFWSDDSVAYVVTVVRDSGNSTAQYTGFVYNYYDSAAFASNNKVFSYFVRTYKNDSVKAYSDIKSVNAKSGNFSTDSTFFHLTAYNRTGYSYVPALDTVKKWADSTKLDYSIGAGNWVSLEDLGATTDSLSDDMMYKVINYTVPLSDTAKIYSVYRAADSIMVHYVVPKDSPVMIGLTMFTLAGGDSTIMTNAYVNVVGKGDMKAGISSSNTTVLLSHGRESDIVSRGAVKVFDIVMCPSGAGLNVSGWPFSAKVYVHIKN